MADIRLDLQILIYREDDFWIAHCLETDLVAEGASPKEAVDSLIDISNVQIKSSLEEGDLASVFSPAPPEVWRMYSIANESQILTRPPLKPVNRLNLRELSLV